MAKIAVIGAGRVGTAVSKIILAITDHEVLLVDVSEQALSEAYNECSSIQRDEYKIVLSPTLPLETYVAFNKDQLDATLRSAKPDAVVCTTPFSSCIEVAEIANRLGVHYIDFTEDVKVSEAIAALNVSRITFVPQCGLAPGLVNYVGLFLFETLKEPQSLEMRVGALPLVAFGPAHYSITWSPEGLVNEYMKPAVRKVQGEVEEVPSLDDHEDLIVNGMQYECFSTSGGIGNLAAYESIPSVQYKTLRYPGHLQFLQKMFAKVQNFEDAVLLTSQTFNRTRDDVVLLVAQATDVTGEASSAAMQFSPCVELNLTALELTTAGTGVAVLELLLDGKLPAGVIDASQIPFDDLMNTNALKLVFEFMN